MNEATTNAAIIATNYGISGDPVTVNAMREAAADEWHMAHNFQLNGAPAIAEHHVAIAKLLGRSARLLAKLQRRHANAPATSHLHFFQNQEGMLFVNRCGMEFPVSSAQFGTLFKILDCGLSLAGLTQRRSFSTDPEPATVQPATASLPRTGN